MPRQTLSAVLPLCLCLAAPVVRARGVTSVFVSTPVTVNVSATVTVTWTAPCGAIEINFGDQLDGDPYRGHVSSRRARRKAMNGRSRSWQRGRFPTTTSNTSTAESIRTWTSAAPGTMKTISMDSTLSPEQKRRLTESSQRAFELRKTERPKLLNQLRAAEQRLDAAERQKLATGNAAIRAGSNEFRSPSADARDDAIEREARQLWQRAQPRPLPNAK